MPKTITVNDKLQGLLYGDGSIEYYRYINLNQKEKGRCHIDDKVNLFPYTDRDFIILKARKSKT